jgi:hypothetical protein
LGAGGFSRLSLHIPQHPTRRRRRIITERPIVVHGVFVYAAARESGKAEHGEAGSRGSTEGAATEVGVAHGDLS